MSKAVLISIQPKWCELIASGKKTIEVRKTKPKIPTPFKCYIYCTKGKRILLDVIKDGDRIFNEIHHGDPQFIKTEEGSVCDMYGKRQKVIGEFVCDKILPISVYYDNPNCKLALKEFPYVCLTDKQVIDYLGNGKQGYGWHISDLKIYDKPKELCEFHQPCKNLEEYEGEVYFDCFNCDYAEDSDYGVIACRRTITRPPQSWCYVERLEGEQ